MVTATVRKVALFGILKTIKRSPEGELFPQYQAMHLFILLLFYILLKKRFRQLLSILFLQDGFCGKGMYSLPTISRLPRQDVMVRKLHANVLIIKFARNQRDRQTLQF